MATAWSFPLADALMVGQDISFVLLIGFAAARIFEAGKEFAAGIVASLLAIKPTYLLPAGIVFLVKSRRGLWGFLTGTAAQVAISFAVGGAVWPWDYLTILRNPLVDPEPGRMLNLRAMAFAFSLPAPVWVIGAVAIYLGYCLFCAKLPIWDCMAAGLAVGLIASPHSRIYDGMVLIPLFVRVATRKSSIGWLALLGLTPVLYLVVLMAPRWWVAGGVLAVVASAVAAGCSLYTRARPRQVIVPAAMARP
jgi:hypothetical protein